MIFNALDVPAEADHVWTEEFLTDGKPGGRAFNVVWLVDPGEEAKPDHSSDGDVEKNGGSPS
jgi:hypothetical protein